MTNLDSVIEDKLEQIKQLDEYLEQEAAKLSDMQAELIKATNLVAKAKAQADFILDSARDQALTNNY